MNNLFRSSLVLAALSLVLTTTSHAAETESGYVDFGQLMPSHGGQFVEVNLSTAMLKFAAKLTAQQEPEAADLIANLKRVRVNVVEMDDHNRADTVAKIETIRRNLESQGWTQMVSVREKAGGDNVDIHVKQHGEDAIDGLVVTVLDSKGEAVFVNIVGNISADQISKIADKLDIEPLKKLHVKFDHKTTAKDV